MAAAACVTLMVAATIVITGGDAPAHTPHDSIADVAVSPRYDEDRTVYTISRTLVLRSTDGGETWERLTNGLDWRGAPTSLTVAGSAPERLYASGFFSGVYRSDDAGTTWTPAGGELGRRSVRSVSASPWNADLVFAVAASDSALWSSSSGGATWTKVAGIDEVTALAFAPDVPGTLLAGSERGALHLSTDSGATWSPVDTGGDVAGPVRALAVSPAYSEDRTWFVGTEDGVLRTTDGGGSFTRFTDGLDDPSTMALAVSPRYGADRTLWVSTYTDGVYESRDGGERWEAASDGLTRNDQADLLDRNHFAVLRATASGRATTLFLAGFDGLFRSRDGGAAWEELETQPATIIMGVAVSPDYAADRTLLVTTYINGLLRSQDSGKTWEPANFGVASQFDWTRSRKYVNRLFPAVYSPDYANDRTAFAASRGIVYRSTDGGAHWRATVPEGAIVEGEVPPDYFFIAPSPGFARDRTVLLGTDGGKVFRSDDGGQTFERLADLGLEVTGLVLSPAFATDGTAFAGTPDGVYRSDDRGTSWTPTPWPQDAGPETSLAVSPAYADDGTLYAGSAGGLLVTTDRGATWRAATGTVPLARGYIDAVAVSPAYADDGTVLVSARGHGVHRSTDGGATWTGPPSDGGRHVTPENFYHATAEPVVFSPAFTQDATVFAFEGESLFRSTDGGVRWKGVPLPVTTHATDPDRAPGPLRETPRATGTTAGDGGGHAGHESAISPNADTADEGGPTARQLALAAICAAGAVAFLWAAERAGRRWRWWFRAGAAVFAFALVLWLLRRR